MVEPSTESEDHERFEETAKFEEEVDTPKVEPKPEQKQARKSKSTEKVLLNVGMKVSQFQNYRPNSENIPMLERKQIWQFWIYEKN